MKVYLASKSPRRRELLKTLIDDFEIGTANIDESFLDELPIKSQVAAVALQKALAFEEDMERESKLERGDLIIAADTLVYLDGVAMQKPKDEEEAAQMLASLRNKRHTVYTGLALIKVGTNNKKTLCTETQVYFKDFGDEIISEFIATGEPMDKAGAYGIQGYGARLVERIDGDFYSVMGLPLAALDDALREIAYYEHG